LIRMAQGGSREAFDLIAARFREPLQLKIRSVLGPLLRGKVEVEDLLQVTLLEAYQAIGQFRGPKDSSFRSWLLTIAQHVVQEQGRRLQAKKAIQAHEVPFAKQVGTDGREWGGRGEALADSGPSPSEMLRGKERLERIKSAIRSLSRDHRRVLIFLFIDRLPVREVARRIERTPKATSLLVRRALNALKGSFGNTQSFRLPPGSLED
jgi:RNA polymerase sigma-70 factor, ECF subfamily